MACACLQSADVNSCSYLERRKRMPQAMGSEVFKTVLFDELVEPVIYCLGVDGFTVMLYKQALLLALPMVAFFELFLFPPTAVFG